MIESGKIFAAISWFVHNMKDQSYRSKFGNKKYKTKLAWFIDLLT